MFSIVVTFPHNWKESFKEKAGVPHTLAKLATYYCILQFGY